MEIEIVCYVGAALLVFALGIVAGRHTMSEEVKEKRRREVDAEFEGVMAKARNYHRIAEEGNIRVQQLRIEGEQTLAKINASVDRLKTAL
jgi:hypothetical protein